MQATFTNSTALLQNAISVGLYQPLIAQLEKDFLLSNLQIDIGLGMFPEDLGSTLHEKVYHLIMEKFSAYLNLLYVIDVPESAFKEIQVTDVVAVAEQVSFLILKREFQKVKLKELYSN
ncbi:hypothetical protein [Maribacter sp. 2-571]|uniref:hypothetical protein n=1 Tax=Maribacter sp. 2-571 TaxID=3417569 RepID=UPI003D346A48